MPILGQVTRRTPLGRMLIAGIYLLLTLGGITMVYPFALMVATSFCSETDADEYRLIPRFFYSDIALYTKFVEAKYAYFAGKWGTIASPATLNRVYRSSQVIYAFSEVTSPDPAIRTAAQWKTLLADYDAFRDWVDREHPGYLRVYFLGRPSLLPAWMIEGEAVSDYRRWAEVRFEGRVAALNAAYHESLPERGGFLYLMPQTELHWDPGWWPDPEDPQYADWIRWRRSANRRFSDIFPVEPSFHRFLENAPDLQEESRKQGLIAALNARWGTNYPSLAAVPLPASAPANPDLRQRWTRFLQNNLSAQYLRISPGLAPFYSRALQEMFGSIDNLNSALGTEYASFAQVPLPRQIVGTPKLLQSALLKCLAIAPGEAGDPFDHITVETPELLYRDFLTRKYGTIDALCKAHGIRAASFAEVGLPMAEIDWMQLQQDKRAFRHWMTWRNYRMVWRFIAGHGHALWNTFILCLGSILFTLTINPLCAYALSRYSLRSTNRILIYLLATMAFPGEVAMIPSFLLLRNLDLLNTYWALLLPGAANGFTVFMMKGFFDTLPRELFEAAKIDGATELRMFFQILIPLCKPVFAYFALGAFTSAYSGFIWAFTICPKEEMWTMMVWLYQLTSIQPFSVQMAALVMAAIPTLLVFTVVQNIILKGIVLPTFH